ncbi:hypothetical protein [Loktanella sp. Alg231-35]|uniref:hypothetical protein n=1 Tax=Loktanella sp. Alg231-35 TaxID=1922220 RepID=UPI00131F19F0|nr:hypothetical protein [Loktanella sp. Alg231-35]
MATLLCATLPGPAMADVIACDLSGTPVRFEIDRTQFAPALDAQEPARRRVTTVQMGDARFPAEPIMIGNTVGFWAEGLGGTELMMIMQADGSAVFANARAGEHLSGTCEVVQ